VYLRSTYSLTDIKLPVDQVESVINIYFCFLQGILEFRS